MSILHTATSTGAGASLMPGARSKTFQAVGRTTSGAGSATVAIQGSIDGGNWVDIGSIPLTLSTTPSTGGLVSDAAWKFVRANVTALTGTGASVTVYVWTEKD